MNTDDIHAAARGDEAALPASVRIDHHDLPAWPDEQSTAIVADAQIAVTRFADHALYHEPLVAAALAAERDPRFGKALNIRSRGACGQKAYGLPDWGVPAATLVHARALLFAHQSLGRCAVYADDAWASIYRDGDYCMPHSHFRSDVSIVYMLDPGDPDPDDPYAGRLCFNDPRIAWCCNVETGRATRPLMPAMEPGTMLLFASSYLHSVNPYHGQRPRITLSWNITRRRLAGSPHPAAA
jgi:hypothetical protein